MYYRLSYKELLVELKFVSKIPEQKIVNFKSHKFEERGDWNISRWWNGQNREETIKRLQIMINQTENFLNNLKDYERSTLLRVFKESLPGIKNIASTYEDDIYTNCRIDQMYDEAQELIQKYDTDVVSQGETVPDNDDILTSTRAENNYYDE